MEVWRSLVHVQHHIKHPQMGVALLEALRKFFENCRRPFPSRGAAPAVLQVADLEDRLVKYLLLLSLPDMLIIVCDLIPGLFLFGVVGGQGLVEDLVVDLFQIIVAVGHILLRPAPVYIRRKKLPVIMADTAWAHHAGYGCTDKITLLSIVLTSCKSHLTIAPARGQPLFVPFSWEKGTQKHFHTTAPLGLAV